MHEEYGSMNSPTTHPETNPVSPNGQASKVGRSPTSAAPSGLLRKSMPWLFALAMILIVVVTLSLTFTSVFKLREPFTGPTFTAAKQKLTVTIVERGSLESAENSEIICRVKAAARGSTSASTIKWVIDDGTQVKAGDRLIELDDSGFIEQLKNKKNDVNEAYVKWIDAKTNIIILDSQNDTDIKSAEVAKNLAEVDLRKFVGSAAGNKLLGLQTHEALQKYLSGNFKKDVEAELKTADNKLTSEYLQALKDIEGRIEVARSDQMMWSDRALWSQLMVAKGYYSKSQAEADQSRSSSADIAMRKVRGEFDIYRDFILERTIIDLWGKVKEAERKLQTVIKQADPKMEKATADETARKAIYDQELDRLHELEKEEKYYRINSPQDGMVVYYVAESSRNQTGSQNSIIAQGEPVREGQKLIRIPNLNKMLVNTRVHEAMVSKVFGEKTLTTGYSDILRHTFSMGRFDMFGLASYYSAFDQLDVYFKDKDQIVVSLGQEARIRIDAFPGKTYRGRVKSKATLASATEFFSSDVKVYQTMVTIDDEVDVGLQPGMSAEVTILANESTEPVLVIPIQSVVGNVSMGSNRKCYVLDAAGYPHERDIVVGMSNDKLVEVRSGIEEGEKVVLNPRPLLPEKTDMKPGSPSTRRNIEFEEGGGKKGGKKGGGKKGGAGGGALPEQIPNPKTIQRPDGGIVPNPSGRKE
jgi:HlyD family secretion protein